MNKLLRRIGTAAGCLGIGLVLFSLPNPTPEPMEYGVTFSVPHAEGIGLDWQEAYDALLDDLGVRRLRLIAYWNQIEPTSGQYDFSALDYQLNEAAERNASVILAIGRKLPRWPECHVPDWVFRMSEAQQRQRVEALLTAVVTRYRDHPALVMWQVENEPLFDFGHCPPADLQWLQRETALVRAIDNTHPILITDSGELNSWLPAARFGDVLGTTVYRTVFSSRTLRPFSYDYIFPAWVYRFKARYVHLLWGKDVIIAELQGEPWGHKPYTELTPAERQELFPPEYLQSVGNFAARTQLTPAYWWGAEYWYWEKVQNGNAAYWEVARQFFPSVTP